MGPEARFRERLALKKCSVRRCMREEAAARKPSPSCRAGAVSMQVHGVREGSTPSNGNARPAPLRHTHAPHPKCTAAAEAAGAPSAARWARPAPAPPPPRPTDSRSAAGPQTCATRWPAPPAAPAPPPQSRRPWTAGGTEVGGGAWARMAAMSEVGVTDRGGTCGAAGGRRRHVTRCMLQRAAPAAACASPRPAPHPPACAA